MSTEPEPAEEPEAEEAPEHVVLEVHDSYSNQAGTGP